VISNRLQSFLLVTQCYLNRYNVFQIKQPDSSDYFTLFKRPPQPVIQSKEFVDLCKIIMLPIWQLYSAEFTEKNQYGSNFN